MAKRDATAAEVQKYAEVHAELRGKIKAARRGGVTLHQARDLVFAEVGATSVRHYLARRGVFVTAVTTPWNPTEYYVDD